MLKVNSSRIVLFAALALALAACAGPREQPPQPRAEKTQSDLLADRLAAEALASYHLQADASRTLELGAAAAKQAPARADLAYLLLSLCRDIEGCDPAPYETRLRQLDPENSIVWMRALQEARERRDEVVEIQVLEALGRGGRFDVYWNPLVASVTDARIALGAGADAALSETVGWLGETLIPPLNPLTRACSRARTQQPEWAVRCKKVAQVLLKSDTYIAESVGLAIARQATSDPGELAKLEQRNKTARYLWRESGTIINSQVERNRFANELLKLMRSLRREQDVQLAVVRWAGRPATPPPGWVE